MSRIPENVLAVQWGDGGIALRQPDGSWVDTYGNTFPGRQQLDGFIQPYPTEVKVLASRPGPTLAEVVGDALAFIAEHKECGRLLGFRDGDGWLVYDGSAGGSLGRAALEHWGKYADLSSVVPLVPRQP